MSNIDRISFVAEKLQHLRESMVFIGGAVVGSVKPFV